MQFNDLSPCEIIILKHEKLSHMILWVSYFPWLYTEITIILSDFIFNKPNFHEELYRYFNIFLAVSRKCRSFCQKHYFYDHSIRFLQTYIRIVIIQHKTFCESNLITENSSEYFVIEPHH